MKDEIWGYEITTSDGIRIIINHKDGCINIRDDMLAILKWLILPQREIKIKWYKE